MIATDASFAVFLLQADAPPANREELWFAAAVRTTYRSSGA